MLEIGECMSLDVVRSVEAGGWQFPGRDDYLALYDIAPSEETGLLELDADTAITIQRDWHTRGQNGCVLAMHAARMLDREQWSATVLNELPEPDVMRDTIEQAVADPNNQIHSFLFPNVTSPDQLREVIDLAVEAGCVLREHSEVDGVEVFRLRWVLGDVESWMVGFASMTDVPPTRRAPFTELVVRTKLRGKEIHPDLNHDADAAHVANIDLGYDQATVGKLIGSSKRRTAQLLGGPALRAATPGARAKTTYGITLPESEQQPDD